jgi:predicted ATPase
MGGDAFVGREAVLQSLYERTAHGERLITLTGSAGLGKTRVAKHFAFESPTRFTEALGEGTPIVWCDVSNVVSRDGIMRCFAEAFGVVLLRAPEIEYLLDALAFRGGMLVVIDHADGCLDALRVMLPQLLGACPELRVIVTADQSLQTDS